MNADKTTPRPSIRPVEVSDLDMAFGTRALELMPPYSDIPEDFKRDTNTWVQLQSDWFFRGLPRGTEFQPRDGVDVRTAQRHLGAIQGSFEPKHEHKMAAVAYLASLWFVRVVSPSETYGEAEAAA